MSAVTMHWQPSLEFILGFMALSMKSSSLSDISDKESIPLSMYTWHVLQAHTAPQL